MEIVKTIGLPDKYLWKEQKINLCELVPKLKILPKWGEIKRVFYRTCPIYGRRLIPFPHNTGDKGFLPKVFVGDILINSKNIVESVLVKFVFEDERVIPVHEWVETTKEILQREDELFARDGAGDEVEDFEEQHNAIRAELKNVVTDYYRFVHLYADIQPKLINSLYF